MSKHYISLGSGCGVAYQLQKLGIKEATLPFDWVKCSKIKDVLSALQKGPESFCSFGGLTYLRDSDHHPTICEEWNSIIHTCSAVYQNNGITFFHDFPCRFINENDPCYLSFREKYERRFNRLFQLFGFGDHLVFIRDEQKINQFIYQDLLDLVNWIKKQLTNNSISRFVLIANNPRNKKFQWMDRVEDDGIIFINDTELITGFDGWQRGNLDWRSILFP